MSRGSLYELLKCNNKKLKPINSFDYEALTAPPIRAIIPQYDIDRLCDVATSVRYAARISKKKNEIISIMAKHGFKKSNAGTNRLVFNFLEDNRFVAKTAIDSVGMSDNPAEFNAQYKIKPYCTKIFEVDNSGVLGFSERVSPITSIDELYSIYKYVFDLFYTIVVKRGVILADIGSSKYRNIGVRNLNGIAFGPVLLDFPYVYDVDFSKIICKMPGPNGMICGGEIKYNTGFDGVICKKCGRTYRAIDLAQKYDGMLRDDYTISDKDIIKPEKDDIIGGACILVNGVPLRSQASSKNYITKEQYKEVNRMQPYIDENGNMPVAKTVRKKRVYKTKNNNFYRENDENLLLKYFGNNEFREYNNEVVVSKTINSKAEKEAQAKAEEIHEQSKVNDGTDTVYRTVDKEEPKETRVELDNNTVIVKEEQSAIDLDVPLVEPQDISNLEEVDEDELEELEEEETVEEEEIDLDEAVNAINETLENMSEEEFDKLVEDMANDPDEEFQKGLEEQEANEAEEDEEIDYEAYVKKARKNKNNKKMSGKHKNKNRYNFDDEDMSEY